MNIRYPIYEGVYRILTFVCGWKYYGSGIGKPFGLLQRGKVAASLCIQQRLL